MKKLFAFLGFFMVGCSVDSKPTKSSKIYSLDAITQSKNPADARASASGLALTAATEAAGFQVPGFTLSLINADYAEVLRCNAGTKLIAPNGMEIKDIPADYPSRTENMRRAFSEARANYNACKTVGDYVIKSNYRDLSAPAGNWFYVVNPCVNKENSTSATENCSYELVLTEAMPYTNELGKAFLDATTNLYTAEAKLSAVYSRMYRAAELTKMVKEACDQSYVAKMASKQLQNALMDIASVGLQVGVNAILNANGVTGGGEIVSTVFSAFRTIINMRPNPQWQCPQAETIRIAAETDYKSIPALVNELHSAHTILTNINSQYIVMDEAILAEVQKNK